jgi:hypothetical protein
MAVALATPKRRGVRCSGMKAMAVRMANIARIAATVR